MKTNQLSQEEIILKSKDLANSIIYNNELLTEWTVGFLTENHKNEVLTTSENYKSLIIDILSLLSNPEISKNLNPVSQIQVGSFLNKLFTYLNFIEINEKEIQKFCDFIRLSRFSGGITENELADYSLFYKN